MASLHGDLHHAHEIGGMTCGGEHTETFECLVDGASVRVLFDDVVHLSGLQPDVWHLGVEHLGLRLFETALLMIPSTTFQVKTMDIGTIGGFCFLGKFGVFQDLVFPTDLIDSDCVLSSEILLKTGKETLGKEESRQPEVGRLARQDPLVDL